MKMLIITALIALSAQAFAQTRSDAEAKVTAENVVAKMTPELSKACGNAIEMNRIEGIYHLQLKDQFSDYVDVVNAEENIKDKTGLDISFAYYEYYNDSWLSKYDHEDLAKARAAFCAHAQ